MPTMWRLIGRQEHGSNARVLCGMAYPTVRRRPSLTFDPEDDDVQTIAKAKLQLVRILNLSCEGL